MAKHAKTLPTKPQLLMAGVEIRCKIDLTKWFRVEFHVPCLFFSNNFGDTSESCLTKLQNQRNGRSPQPIYCMANTVLGRL